MPERSFRVGRSSAGLGLFATKPIKQGAFIVATTSSGPAAKAGMKANDIVVSFNGSKIKSMDDLVVAIRETKVGDRATLVVVRGGHNLTLHAVGANYSPDG